MQSLLELNAQIRVLKRQVKVGPLKVLAEGYFEDLLVRKWHYELLTRGMYLSLAVGHRKIHVDTLEVIPIEVVELKTLVN